MKHRFFFHFRQGSLFVADSEGIELANTEEAYLEAYQAAQEMWGELLGRRQDPRRCAFEVHDASGTSVFHLPFAELLDSCNDRRTKGIVPAYHDAVAAVTRAKRLAAEFRAELHSVRGALRESAELLGMHEPGRKIGSRL